MAKVVLLSCTKSKLDHRAPAQELYSASPMFKKTLEYGKSLQPDKMFILSAKHHLVPLNKQLDPYDKTLKEMSADEKEQWGVETVKQMQSAGLNPNKDQFIFLTGSEYLKPFEKYIPQQNMVTPMAGRRLGERLRWLNAQISKLNEIFKSIKKIINEYFTK